MDDVVTWLRAQLDDDERLARDAAEQSAPAWRYGEYPAEADTVEVAEHIERHDPARVLAEVDAKRRIIDRLAEDAAFDMPATKAQAASHDEWYRVVTARDVVKSLALPYADRPGYRPEWRP